MVHLRFDGDSEGKKIWLEDRKEEEDLIVAFSELLLQAWKHDEAVTSAARNVELRQAEEREVCRAADREFQARASVRAPVEAAAEAAGRPRISAANAAAWQPPDVYARGADGAYLHLVETRRYSSTINSPHRGILSQDEHEALPEHERELCKWRSCTHKSRAPPCERHCRCKGFRKLTREFQGRSVVVGVHSDCQFVEKRTVESWINLSEPILWYWQMTGDTFYGGIRKIDKVLGFEELYGSLEAALCFTKAHVRKYNEQVQNWRDMCASAQSGGKAARKRKVAVV